MGKKAINIEEVIAANDSSNVLAGTRFENVEQTGFLLLAQTGSAAGLESELFVAGNNALERSAVGDQARTPVVPDDVIVDEVEAYAGQKIQLRVYNTTGAPLTYRARLIIDDNVGMA